MNSSTKRQVLKTIYDVFGQWAERFSFACSRGCAACCTQDVMLTRAEALLLLDYILGEYGRRWLEKKLGSQPIPWPLVLTTNDYAAACLKGKEIVDTDRRRHGVCPFLENNCCSVYPARPFSCRCFASTRVCRNDSTALLPPHYLSAATALSQVIEHLGQFEPWGNMLDLLFLLAPSSAAADCPDNGREDLAEALSIARSNCLTAQPLPGFLIEEKDTGPVGLLLDSVFKRRVGAKTIEALLNNR